VKRRRPAARLAARLAGPVAALVGGTGLLVAFAPAASAQELSLVDGRGDVWSSDQAGFAQPAPGADLGDVRRAKLAHRADRIVVRLAFVDLARRGTYAQYAVTLQGRRHGHHVTREVIIAASPRHWSGRARVYKPRGDLVDCNVHHVIDYDRDLVRLRVDRDCLNRPGAARMNVNTTRADGAGEFYSDNPHDDQAYSRDWSDWVRRTR
jgi:hypothetical protein